MVVSCVSLQLKAAKGKALFFIFIEEKLSAAFMTAGNNE
ncbi:hypothetical protein AsAng_0060730 [Aureispira anguillae]|uniref:Uncharacterized protein n=1 Tax=Aureispira anguillae TaxID=2864201 RepID=A0A915YLM9_9BACT|nr:hypothetical protein AsAng_0060730 [Aureispira anguillae]